MKRLMATGQKYFLTPVCLVPNGRAHLGHVAGPLLKMDVLRRDLLRRGASVCMVSLSDVHEAHVAIRAHNEGSTPEHVANHFHEQIVADMRCLRIEYDDLINPLDSAWASRYDAIVRDLVHRIVANENAAAVAEAVPHLVSASGPEPAASSMRPRVGDPVVSGWLKGRCPWCSQVLVGFFCEACGGHFPPREMVDVGTAHFDGQLELRERSSLYLKLRKGPEVIRRHLEQIHVRSDFLELAERYMRAQGASIRLTVPSPWGLSLEMDGIAAGEVIWSYSALLYGCHLVAGERYRELTGAEDNPMALGSDVQCILSFGMDNTVPFLVGAVGCALAQDRYKPFDGFLVNYFFDLEGSKFSTSRGHVIWAGDIVTLGGADTDLVRAYLCTCGPEFKRTGFDIEEFIQFHNSVGQRLRVLVDGALERARSAQQFDARVRNYLGTALEAQVSSLSLATFDLAGALGAVSDWMRKGEALTSTPDAALTWLVGFALLASPIFPDVCAWLSAQFEPRLPLHLDVVAESAAPPRVAPNGVPVPLSADALTRAQFNACLPRHLRR